MTDLFSIAGKTAVVTGGSRGIGLMIARGFVEAGVKVYISSRKADVCDQVAAELSEIGECVAIPANLSTEDECRRLAGEIADREASLDILVNNAAAPQGLDRQEISSVPVEVFDEVIRINLRGTYLMSRAAVPQMRAQRWGRIIAVSSMAGVIPAPYSTAYSASKAGSDLIALSYCSTYGLPVTVTRCTNNFGPYQYPEKALPLFTTNLIDGGTIPLYGDGLNERDWLYVDDHCAGVGLVLAEGAPGEIYNIGAGNETPNRVLVDKLLALFGVGDAMVTYVEDRLGHDRRYSLGSEKLQALGWRAEVGFDEGIRRVLGVSTDSLSKDWIAATRRAYLPVLEGRTRPTGAGVPGLQSGRKTGDPALATTVDPDGQPLDF